MSQLNEDAKLIVLLLTPLALCLLIAVCSHAYAEMKAAVHRACVADELVQHPERQR